jgi:hypothetical protein
LRGSSSTKAAAESSTEEKIRLPTLTRRIFLLTPFLLLPCLADLVLLKLFLEAMAPPRPHIGAATITAGGRDGGNGGGRGLSGPPGGPPDGPPGGPSRSRPSLSRSPGPVPGAVVTTVATRMAMAMAMVPEAEEVDSAQAALDKAAVHSNLPWRTTWRPNSLLCGTSVQATIGTLAGRVGAAEVAAVAANHSGSG